VHDVSVFCGSFLKAHLAPSTRINLMLSPILFVIRELYRRHSYLARRLNSLQNCSKLNSAHVHGLKMKSLRLKIAALLEG